MANDPLAAFRRQQPDASFNPQTVSPQQATGQATTGLKPYKAFEIRERAAERLEIRRVLGETHAPSYRYLMDVSFNGQYGTELLLVYSFLIVKIKGKNLQPVIYAILEGRCHCIQDFHPNEFASPQANEPVIESIAFAPESEGKK